METNNKKALARSGQDLNPSQTRLPYLKATKSQDKFDCSQSEQERSAQQSGVSFALRHWEKGRPQNQDSEESKGNLKAQH